MEALKKILQKFTASPSKDARDDTSKSSSQTRSLGKEGNDSTAEDITWLYLTYNTPLPHPSTPSEDPRQGDNSQLAIPDLTPYTDPLQWSSARKNVPIWLSCTASCITAYGAGSYAPGVELMSADWNVSATATFVGITMFCAGFAVAPMVLAPFSELVGRRPVFLVTGFLWFVFTLCCAATQSFGGMLISRFLVGCASSTFSTMGAGVVADLYVADDRNTPMTLFTATGFFGTGLGPLVSGFLVNAMGWRFIFYFHSILVGLMVVSLILFFKETRGTVLLSRRAKKLNEWYERRENAGHSGFDMPVENSDKAVKQRIRWKVKSDEERATIGKMISISLTRPFFLLITEPVVFFFSLWAAFAWAILFAQFSVVPYVFETVYNFAPQNATAVFSVVCIGTIIANFASIGQDKYAAGRRKGAANPERRLVFPCIGSIIMAGALFWFGWTSRSSIHWIVPVIAIGFATFGIFSIYLAAFNYLADTYHRYASSAIAAQSFCRNLMAGAFPLFTQHLYANLGYGPAGSLLGGVGILLAAVPWVLLFYGPKIRARSKFASEIMAEL